MSQAERINRREALQGLTNIFASLVIGGGLVEIFEQKKIIEQEKETRTYLKQWKQTAEKVSYLTNEVGIRAEAVVAKEVTGQLDNLLEQCRKQVAAEKSELTIDEAGEIILRLPWEESECRRVKNGFLGWKLASEKFWAAPESIILEPPRINPRLVDISEDNGIDLYARSQGYPGQGHFLVRIDIPFRSESGGKDLLFVNTVIDSRPSADKTKKYDFCLALLSTPAYPLLDKWETDSENRLGGSFGFYAKLAGG